MNKCKKRKRRVSVAKIVLGPNKILTQKCDRVKRHENIESITLDMYFVLTNSKTGVGISANQVGYSKRIIIVKDGGYYITMINPEILERHFPVISGVEGCLSYPGKNTMVERFSGITVSYQTSSSHCSIVRELSGLVAITFQHEYDHLNGICKVNVV